MSVHACCIPLLPKEKAQDARTAAARENPKNTHHSKANEDAPKLSGLVGPKGKPLYIGLDVTKMWAAGRTLKVRFLEGSDEFVRNKIKQYAVIWSEYANIRFKFVEHGDAEIRVGFVWDDGSWSYIGTDCLQFDQDTPTMNFGWFHDGTPDEEFSRVTLHEFGHALGCVHEHQQPNAHIQWNEDAVYEWHAKKSNWSRTQVYEQIIRPASADTVVATQLDALSIMVYPIPPEWTLDGWSTPVSNHLSEKDKAFIREKYPFPLQKDKFCVGIVNTMAIRDWQRPALDNRITIMFDRPFQEPPFVLLGLNYLDFNKGKNIRIRSSIEEVHSDKMTVNLASWSDTIQYASGCSWLVTCANEGDFQFGHFSTEADHPPTKPQPTTHKHISFSRQYQNVPSVVVWLDALDVDHSHNCRVRAYVSDVTTSGFEVHIDSWDDTTLFSASVFWAAHSKGRKDMCSGSFSTSDIRSFNPPRCDNAGTVSFDTTFSARPQVFAGLNMVDMGNSGGQRLRLKVDNIMPTNMEWHLDAWDDTSLYTASASYLAVKY
ncbi:hypothetical protein EIP86_000028 [Pleurotus ostreatoroseus]|nr:hypothetical protein EIP86_000028 [Pleurotus ostreatoroseus]